MNKQLQIFQYNVNRSRDTVMAQFLRDPEVLRADIIAIQEPWRNPYSDTTHHPAYGSHQLLYPTADNTGDRRARVALYISRKINSRAWKHTVYSADCQELELHLHGRKLRIFTIYNPGPWDTDRTGTVDLLNRVVPSRGITSSSATSTSTTRYGPNGTPATTQPQPARPLRRTMTPTIQP